MTANLRMKTLPRRIATVFLLAVVMACFFVLPVSAAGVDAKLDAMGNDIYYYYTVFRNHIAMPCIILSFSSAGFQILSTIFTSSSGDLEKVKKQVLYTVMALFVLFFLPVIIGWAKDHLASTAWKPGAFLIPTIYGR